MASPAHNPCSPLNEGGVMTRASPLVEACVDEYESHLIYQALSRAPLIGGKTRSVLARASAEEHSHYLFWRSIVGECRSRLSGVKTLVYLVLLLAFGLTVVMKIIESKEKDASSLYRRISEERPDLRDMVAKMIEQEERHEEEFIQSIGENRVKYIGSITLGLSDALIELTGVYTGALGVLNDTLTAGLMGGLAGLTASISMGVASFNQARQEGRLNPLASALYTLVAYLAVTIALAAPYFILKDISMAFSTMLLVSIGITAYLSVYTAVLHGKSFAKEFALTLTLVLGIAFLLYFLGSLARSLFGIDLY
ncbi:MAG: ferritin family protein [Thermosphaera sp.]